MQYNRASARIPIPSLKGREIRVREILIQKADTFGKTQAIWEKSGDFGRENLNFEGGVGYNENWRKIMKAKKTKWAQKGGKIILRKKKV